MMTAQSYLSMAAFTGMLLFSAQSARSQQMLASGKFMGLTPAGCVVDEGGAIKTVPLRPTAYVSIRGEFDIAELQKGHKVVLSGRIEEGSKTVEGWGLVFYPLAPPRDIQSTFRVAVEDRKAAWSLQAFCVVLSTDPLKVQILPGNQYQSAVWDKEAKVSWLVGYKGKKLDGLIIELGSGERRRGPDSMQIEFGLAQEYAGKDATVEVRGSGIPLRGETVRVRRTEPFTMPSQPIRATKGKK